MNLFEILKDSADIVLILLTLIQIAPIKVNPWTKICKAFGRAINTEVMDKLRESDASNARYRILRFDDEVRHHVKHTEEHFNQILADIDDYEKYCREHPDYKNNKAVAAIRNTKAVYEKCRAENSFLV